jgi:hypothetical protein
VPADARKFRVDDPRLAATLTAAGAEIVETDADVDVQDARTRTRDARVTVLRIEGRSPTSPVRSIRALQRAWRSSKLRARFPAALLWDERLPLPAPLRSLPLGALVVRGDVHPTALESAAAAARTRLQGRPVVRQGLVVAATDRGVLRVGIGPAAGQIASATASLAALRAAAPPSVVGRRIPWILRDGTVGLARWSLERRLPGRTTGPIAAGACLEFLAALFAVGAGPSAEPPWVPGAEAIAARIAARTDGLPRGFGHGDFWHGNLLVDGDQLVGVVDWDAGGPGRLPLVDYLHLVANAEHVRRRHRSLGETIVSFLLPWARSGGDEPAKRLFLLTTGSDLDPPTLEALVTAYWLDYVAYQLRLYADRGEPNWLEPNVNSVVAALARR